MTVNESKVARDFVPIGAEFDQHNCGYTSADTIQFAEALNAGFSFFTIPISSVARVDPSKPPHYSTSIHSAPHKCSNDFMDETSLMLTESGRSCDLIHLLIQSCSTAVPIDCCKSIGLLRVRSECSVPSFGTFEILLC